MRVDRCGAGCRAAGKPGVVPRIGAHVVQYACGEGVKLGVKLVRYNRACALHVFGDTTGERGIVDENALAATRRAEDHARQGGNAWEQGEVHAGKL